MGLEQRQFSVEHHKPSNAPRFKQPKAKKQSQTTNGQKKKQQKKTNQIEKYSIEWIREKAQFIAMMKLQFGDGDGQMMDANALTLQILELLHDKSITIMALQSQFTDLLGLDAFDLISELIANREQIKKFTWRHMDVEPPEQEHNNGINIANKTSSNPYGA